MDFDAFFEEMSADDATDAAEPETVDAPVDESSPESESPEVVVNDESDAETPDESTASAPTPETPVQQAPPEIDWNDPRLVAMRQDAEMLQGIRAQAEQQQALQSRQRIADKIAELSDGDTSRYNEILGLMAEISHPVQQQSQQHEARATNSEKLATAVLLSMEAHLTPEQQSTIKNTITELMGVDGPEPMQKLAFAERENAKKYSPIIAAKDQKIAELERRLEASARVSGRSGRGANRVDTGSPTAVGSNAENMDSFFNDLWGK